MASLSIGQLQSVSKLRVGVTLTQTTPAETNLGTPVARALANGHIEAMSGAVYNLLAMSHGCTQNVSTSQGSMARNWADLDRRTAWLAARGVKHVSIGLFSAPDWMTTLAADGNYKVLPAYHSEFGALCAEILVRYAGIVPIEYAQVWSELKGYFVAGAPWSWDYSEFTALYNAVYSAIRADSRLNGIKIVGPYITESIVPMQSQTSAAMAYWQANKVGCDIVASDFRRDSGAASVRTEAQYMALTSDFTTHASDMAAAAPGLPVACLEAYPHSDLSKYATLSVEFQAAWWASVLARQTIAGVDHSLAWGVGGDGALADEGVQIGWLMDTRGASGAGSPSRYAAGDKTANYDVFKSFHDYFPPGTSLYAVTSDDADVEGIASGSHVLLVNKNGTTTKRVTTGIYSLALSPYEVRLLPRASVGWHGYVRVQYTPGSLTAPQQTEFQNAVSAFGRQDSVSPAWKNHPRAIGAQDRLVEFGWPSTTAPTSTEWLDWIDGQITGVNRTTLSTNIVITTYAGADREARRLACKAALGI